jgi:hypothetical protein
MFKYTCCFITVLILVFSKSAEAQQASLTDFTPDPVKVQMYYPYLVAHHGGAEAVEALKQSDRFLYFRELWYYTESFSIVENYSAQGTSMSADQIDITRFESQRKYDEAVIITIPGFRDAIRLLAGKDLLHKPDYVR